MILPLPSLRDSRDAEVLGSSKLQTRQVWASQSFLCYWTEWISEPKRPHHPLWAEHGPSWGPTGNILGTL